MMLAHSAEASNTLDLKANVNMQLCKIFEISMISISVPSVESDETNSWHSKSNKRSNLWKLKTINNFQDGGYPGRERSRRLLKNKTRSET